MHRAHRLYQALFGKGRNGGVPADRPLLSLVQPVDLLEYGIISELAGRTTLVTTQPVDRELMRRILVEPKNSCIEATRRNLDIDDVSLRFRADAYDAIVDAALCFNEGARSLAKVVDLVTLDLRIEAPELKTERSVTITGQYVIDQLKRHSPALQTIAEEANRKAAQRAAEEETEARSLP